MATATHTLSHATTNSLIDPNVAIASGRACGCGSVQAGASDTYAKGSHNHDAVLAAPAAAA